MVQGSMTQSSQDGIGWIRSARSTIAQVRMYTVETTLLIWLIMMDVIIGQQMILNNYSTIRYLVDHKDELFSVDALKSIHRSISNKTLDDSNDEGRIRTDNNIYVLNGITGEIAHTPPDFSDLNGLLVGLCDFANIDNNDPFVHPIVKGIIIHFLLAYFHPFVDGNGRTSRSLVYWYLLKKGYWLTEYLSISRVIYKSKAQYENSFLYTESDGLDLSYFINYINNFSIK